jgi:hypothetical protein
LIENPKASARSAAVQPPACTTTQIKISEVEADPPFDPDADNEWFELFNTGSECEMSGWTVTDNGATDNLFAGSGGSNVVRIATGGHIIVAASSVDFLTNHSGFAGALIQIGDTVGTVDIGNGLANASDQLLLEDSSDTDVDCVKWGATGANNCGFNVVAAAGTNATLQRTPTDGTDTNTAADWTSATESPSGTPTAVFLASLTARSVKTHIIIRWETVSEFDVVGFNVLRSTNPVGPYAQINPTLIPAQNSGGVSGASYRYADADVVSGTTYYYLLETVNPDGNSQQFGPLTVQHRGFGVLESPGVQP